MASFGIYDGTDDEPEDERLAREAREKVLREEAAAASQAFRDSDPFSDGVTTGADGGSGPFKLDPFNVIGVRETPEEKEWREWRERTIAEAGGQNPVTTLNPFDPTRESAADREIRLAKEAQMRDFDISGITPKPDTITIGDPSKTITVPNDAYVVGTPAFEAREAAEAKAIQDAKVEAEIAAMVAAGKPPPIAIGNPLDAIGAAITGATQIIKDPITGISNIGTNVVDSIFGTGNGQTTITALPVDPITGLVLTGAALANATRATRARDAAAKAAAEAAAAKAAGVSPEEQARLDAAEQKAVQDQIAADAAVRAQGGTTNISAGVLVPAATGVGSVPAVGPFDVRTAAQIQADRVEQARLDAIATAQKEAQDEARRVSDEAKIAAAQAAAQATAQAIDQEAAWKRQQVAVAAAAQQQRDREAAAIAGMGVATPTTTKTGPDGLFGQPTTVVTPITPVTPPPGGPNCNPATEQLSSDGKTCVPKVIPVTPVTPPPVTPPPGGPNCNPATEQLSTDGKTCVPKVIPVNPPPSSTCPAGQEKVNGTCVARCSAGQERNAQGVCVVPPVNPPPGGTTTIIPVTPPSNPFTMSTITPAQRDLNLELGRTTDAFKNRRNALRDVYGDALGDYSDADMDAYERISGRMRGTNVANTEAASAQTIAANRALRDANLADVNRLGGAAKLNRETLNSQLYGNLNQYSTEASAALGRDMDALRLAEAKQLSPEDIRNSQQAAREAWSARGLVNSRGAVGAEILNRDSLARQREAEARAKVQQSYGNLQQATAMEMANVFDPQAAILGGQYGMQTQNYGTNAALYGQSAEQTRGSQDYVRRVFNPMGEYPNNIEDFNVNAVTAASIAKANNEASIEAARQAGMYGLTSAAIKNAGAVWNGVRWVWDTMT